MTTRKSTRNRKSSTRVRPKRAGASAARALPAAVPAASAAAPPEANPATEANDVTAVVADGVPPTAGAASAGICVQLEAGLEIKDTEGVHRVLLAALGDGRAITVDVGRVHAVDTAGAQLLLAFQGEASRCGVSIEFRGESPPLNHTLALLGLSGNFTFAVPHG